MVFLSDEVLHKRRVGGTFMSAKILNTEGVVLDNPLVKLLDIDHLLLLLLDVLLQLKYLVGVLLLGLLGLAIYANPKPPLLQDNLGLALLLLLLDHALLADLLLVGQFQQ